MASLSTLSARFFVVIALIVAMATSGFAHKAVVSEVDDDLMSYVAAGGSLDDLCGQLGLSTGQSCDACRLVDQADVPPIEALFRGCIDVSVASPNVAAQTFVAASDIDPAHPVRAPPVV